MMISKWFTDLRFTFTFHSIQIRTQWRSKIFSQDPTTLPSPHTTRSESKAENKSSSCAARQQTSSTSSLVIRRQHCVWENSKIVKNNFFFFPIKFRRLRIRCLMIETIWHNRVDYLRKTIKLKVDVKISLQSEWWWLSSLVSVHFSTSNSIYSKTI